MIKLVGMLDGLNRYRFDRDPHLLAVWESAKHVVTGPQAKASEEKPAPPAGPAQAGPEEVKPAAYARSSFRTHRKRRGMTRHHAPFAQRYSGRNSSSKPSTNGSLPPAGRHTTRSRSMAGNSSPGVHTSTDRASPSTTQ